MSSAAVEKAYVKNSLDKLKADELKQYLKENKLKQAGDKSFLVWRIKSFIECKDKLIDGVNPLSLKGAKLRKACAQRQLSCIGNDDEMHELLVSYQKENVTATSQSSSNNGGTRSKSDIGGSNGDAKRIAAIELANKVLQLNDEGDYEGILCLTGSKITSTSSTAQMRKAYLKMSVIIHPDKLKDFDKSTIAFQALVTAFERLSQPELYEEKQSTTKASSKKTIMRSNKGCFRTRIGCPRCHSAWGLPLSGLPDYCYNIFMQGLKTYCCSECLFEFGCLTADHKCPTCSQTFQYDPNDYHRHVSCGNENCHKTFGFYTYNMSTRAEKTLREEITDDQLKKMKKREQLQARAARGKRKNIAQNADENLIFQEKLFLHKLIDECPRCGEIPEDVDLESLRLHLKECTDKKKHSIHRKKKVQEEEIRQSKKLKIDKQDNMQSLKVWEYLGSEQSQLYLLSEGAIRKACEEKEVDVTGLDRNGMISNLVATKQKSSYLTNGTTSANKLNKCDFKRDLLPPNLHELSIDQIRGICACHGYEPKSMTKNGMIREIENELEKSEGKGDSKLMLEHGITKKKGIKKKSEVIEIFDSGNEDSDDEEYTEVDAL